MLKKILIFCLINLYLFSGIEISLASLKKDIDKAESEVRKAKNKLRTLLDRQVEQNRDTEEPEDLSSEISQVRTNIKQLEKKAKACQNSLKSFLSQDKFKQDTAEWLKNLESKLAEREAVMKETGLDLKEEIEMIKRHINMAKADLAGVRYVDVRIV